MIIVSKQTSEKDRRREGERDIYQLLLRMMTTLRIFVYVCVWARKGEPLFPFFYSSSVDGIRKRMRTGGLYERKHIDNCQYKTEEEICGNNRHDQLLFPLSLFFSLLFPTLWFICLLSFSFFRTWSGLGLIFSLPFSLCPSLVLVSFFLSNVPVTTTVVFLVYNRKRKKISIFLYVCRINMPYIEHRERTFDKFARSIFVFCCYY